MTTLYTTITTTSTTKAATVFTTIRTSIATGSTASAVTTEVSASNGTTVIVTTTAAISGEVGFATWLYPVVITAIGLALLVSGLVGKYRFVILARIRFVVYPVNRPHDEVECTYDRRWTLGLSTEHGVEVRDSEV